MSYKKQIIFRADGNVKTGLGHLFRLFAILEMVREDYSYVYFTRPDSTVAVIPEHYNYKLLPEHLDLNDEAIWFSGFYNPKETVVIADGYQFNSTYQKMIKEKGFKLIYIDDLASEYMYADVIINHSPHVKDGDFKSEPYTKFALGTEYSILRPLFLEAAKQKRVIKKIDSAFVCFGGADPYNLSLKAAEACLKLSNFKQIHVVLGGAYQHRDIFSLEKVNSDKLKTYKNLSEKELIKVMKLCHFAIAPASTILYELCCIKMLILSGYYVENQKNIYKGLAKLNVIYEGGDFRKVTNEDFELMIASLLKSTLHNTYLENQSKLFDGNSTRRVLGLVNGLHISFREATEKDMLTVFEWSNDDLVRQNSYNSDEIALENHKKWFMNKIKDEKVLFLIAMVNNKPSGIVRYEINKAHSVVGIVVSKAYRGQGLAASFLEYAALYYFRLFTKPIYAYIKKDNQASIKSFEKARYKLFKDEIIKGNLSFVYKLEKSDVER